MMKGYEKAAAVLSLLGDELSQKVLSYLPEESAVNIIKASETLKTPTKENLLEIVSQFNDYMKSAPTPPEGQEAGALASSEPQNPRAVMTPIEMISAASPENIAKAIQPERPEIAAYVLSHLPVDKIYEVLNLMGASREMVESRLVNIKDVPITKELEDKILKTISERLA